MEPEKRYPEWEGAEHLYTVAIELMERMERVRRTPHGGYWTLPKEPVIYGQLETAMRAGDETEIRRLLAPYIYDETCRLCGKVIARDVLKEYIPDGSYTVLDEYMCHKCSVKEIADISAIIQRDREAKNVRH